MQNSIKFLLSQSKNKNIYKEITKLEFNAATADDVYSWKKSFVRVGIFGDNVVPNDPSMYDLCLHWVCFQGNFGLQRFESGKQTATI